MHKYFLGEKMHGDADIFTANMYLAEDRVSDQFVVIRLLIDMSDTMLGVGLEAWRLMDPALCQVSVCCYRCSRSGSRVDIATSALAQRFILRRGPQYLSLPIARHIPSFASFGYISKWSTNVITWYSPGSPSYVLSLYFLQCFW